MTTKVTKTDAEWKAELSPEEYKVLRKAATERPWSGKYVETKTVGSYRCRACGTELFRSAEKRPTVGLGTHTVFAAAWFRMVLVLAAIGTLLVVSVPYLLGLLTP